MELLHDGTATVLCSSRAAAREKGGESEAQQLVSISHEELLDPSTDLSAKVGEAFGATGLGALTVSGVPNLEEKRRRLLTLAQKFAVLPDEVKSLYEDPDSSYNFGWSHGMESLTNGKKDLHKGSFYANPLMDIPKPTDSELVKQYPAYFRPNVWPKQHLPELELAFKDLGSLIIEVGLLLTARCDKYVEATRPRSGVCSNELLGVLQRSSIHKGRLLHYFPPPTRMGDDLVAAGAESNGESCEWCGWHTDHGSLTGLTSAMYLDANGDEVQNPDPLSGLYIRSRSGGVIKANIPPNHLGYQVGEAMQIHSGGLLRATPHCVRAPGRSVPESEGVSRNTFAVFMQPDAQEPMRAPPGVPDADVAVGQWSTGQDFGQFSAKTFQQYYR